MNKVSVRLDIEAGENVMLCFVIKMSLLEIIVGKYILRRQGSRYSPYKN
jgi:hypothetical protein